MSRKPRKILLFDSCTCHKVWRGHNREYNLESDVNKKMYMRFMKEEHKRSNHDISITAMCIMSNHTHELNKIGKVKNFSNYMRRHHSKYGRYFNDVNARCGKVAQGRPYTACFESEYHTIETVHYIHYNPVKANIVEKAQDYEWSTYSYYAYGEKPHWLEGINFKFPQWYENLGGTYKERQREYRRLFDIYVKEIEEKLIEDATNKSTSESKTTQKKKFVGNIFIGSSNWIEERLGFVRKFFEEKMQEEMQKEKDP